MTPSPEEVTRLLVDWGNGNVGALEQLTPLVYEELRRLAHQHMNRERPDHTLQTSALINEAYLRFTQQRNMHWQNRAQFFAIASRLMRRVLIDYARARNYQKRGDGAKRVSLSEVAYVSEDRAEELLALDEALNSLESFDKRKSQVVELRFFGGMSVEETAVVLDVSPNTVKRDWSTAKAWLYRNIKKGALENG
jgi:RNA polymerase sigma factor (TIGR02999 family)